jgi:hypothetical protein
MSSLRAAVALSALFTFGLAGCGTYVPEIQEFPADALTGQQFVNLIIFNVTCEVRDAIVQVYHDYPGGSFIDTWGVQVTLNLQIEEKGSANPTANVTPVGPRISIFNLGLGATATADATRINKINWFLPVAEFRDKAPCGDARPRVFSFLKAT